MPVFRRRVALGLLLSTLVSGACGAAAEPQAPRPAKPAAQAPTPAPAGANIPRLTFDGARAWEHLRRQVALGPRPAGSPALDATRKYILAELSTVGVTVRQQAFDADTPAGKIHMVNLIATIPGVRPERIAIASHYDTKLFKNSRFVGASDGASSTAALLELARVLKGRRNLYTMELQFLDGEEAVIEWAGNDHTYGSRYYVASAQRDGSIGSLKALVLLDMIGDKELDIRRDANSTPWLTDIVWAAAQRLGHRGVFLNDLTAIEDDHLPFLRANVPSVDIIDLNYPAWHTAQDDLDHVSAKSLQIVGDVVMAALPDIEQRLAAGAR